MLITTPIEAFELSVFWSNRRRSSKISQLPRILIDALHSLMNKKVTHNLSMWKTSCFRSTCRIILQIDKNPIYTLVCSKCTITLFTIYQTICTLLGELEDSK